MISVRTSKNQTFVINSNVLLIFHLSFSAYPGAKRAPYKKKDIARKAIRDMTSDVDYVHKVVPKTDDAKGLIYGAIKPNLLFRACSSEELIDLVDAFEPQYVPKGSIVIREGDEGDHFYVMERGGIDVYEKDVYKCSLYSGVAFGEIALLYSCPRTATVMAKYDCKLWVINRKAFRGITAQHKKRRLELKLEFLRKASDIQNPVYLSNCIVHYNLHLIFINEYYTSG